MIADRFDPETILDKDQLKKELRKLKAKTLSKIVKSFKDVATSEKSGEE